MHVIFIAIGMHTNLWMANYNFQLHILSIPTCDFAYKDSILTLSMVVIKGTLQQLL